MEHAPLTLDKAVEISVAALDTGITPIVRVPGHEAFHISRVLDGGAMGVVVPHVNTAEEARRAVDACRYAPIGHRSAMGGYAQLGFESLPIREAAAYMNEHTLLAVMIETPQAVENADAIAAIPGIDALLIGTNDLTLEMDISGQIGHERIKAAYATVAAACSRHGKVLGMGGVYDQELATRYIGMGARLILGASDHSLLLNAATQRVEFLRALGLGNGRSS